MSKNVRGEMPEVAAFLDSIREVFGKEMIDGQIRKGLQGQPTFWARENGHRLGTRNTVHTSAIISDERGISRSFIADWIIEARQYAQSKGIDIKPADPQDQNDVEREARELREMLAKARSKK